MSYTVGQAAKATGKSKPTISRAIKSGVISAAKNEDGSYTIDPAELHRVFPPVTRAGNDDAGLKPSETPVLQRENELLREMLTDRDRQIDRLTHRLEATDEERRTTLRQLTALLTDQREQAEPPARRGWWRFGKRAG